LAYHERRQFFSLNLVPGRGKNAWKKRKDDIGGIFAEEAALSSTQARASLYRQRGSGTDMLVHELVAVRSGAGGDN